MMNPKINDFIARANEVHHNEYDYSLWTEYGGTSADYHKRNVPVICPTHGLFLTSISNHLRGSKCPECAKLNRKKNIAKDVSYYITKAEAIHNNFYDYSIWRKTHKTSTDPVEIICPIHGSFFQKPVNHVDKKAGCGECAKSSRIKKNLEYYNRIHRKQSHMSMDTLNKLNDNDWLYNQHVNNKRSLQDISNELEVQDTTVGVYAKKHNIKTVRHPHSDAERELSEWLKTLNVDIITNSRSIINPQEIDIFIPTLNLAIEYCGIFWHSEQNGKDRYYHKTKMDNCAKQNIRLITLFSDEWDQKKEIVQNKIKHIIGASTQKIYARNTKIIQLNRIQKKQFFNNTHIQGNGPSSINYGLLYNDEIVAAVGFIKKQDGIYELNRFSSSVQVVGGFSKLMNHFTCNHHYTEIVSFADCRWSNGDLYKQTGWILDKVIQPDYYYSTNGHDRFHKSNFRRKNLKNRLEHFDPSLTEWENCNNNKLLRIWDCGKIRFVYKNTFDSMDIQS